MSLSVKMAFAALLLGTTFAVTTVTAHAAPCPQKAESEGGAGGGTQQAQKAESEGGAGGGTQQAQKAESEGGAGGGTQQAQKAASEGGAGALTASAGCK
jgi:hypothetical protein